MTLTEWRVKIYTVLKRTAATLPEADLDLYINLGIHYIANLYTFPEMKSLHTAVALVSGQELYDYPPRLKEIYWAVVNNGTMTAELTFRSDLEKNKEFPYNANYANTQPMMAVDYGSQFGVFPLPDAAYTTRMFISQYPAVITAAQTSALVDKDDLIFAASCFIGFLVLRDENQASYWGELFSNLMKPYMSIHRMKAWRPRMRMMGDGMTFSGVNKPDPLVESYITKLMS